MAIKHILVIMDPTCEQQPALNRACFLAHHLEAHIELFVVVHHSHPAASWFLDQQQLAAARQAYVDKELRWLQSYADDLAVSGIAASLDAAWGSPLFEQIIYKVNQSGADLVIKTTHRHPSPGKWLFHPTDWHLLNDCPVPLLLAKDNDCAHYQRLMAAVDPAGSPQHTAEQDINILNTTQSLADTLDAQAFVAHCCDPLPFALWQSLPIEPSGMPDAVPDRERYLKLLVDNHRRAFNELLAPYPVAPAQQLLDEGDAKERLPILAEQHKIDLLIAGSSHHPSMLGSTLERMLDALPCDLFVVRHKANG